MDNNKTLTANFQKTKLVKQVKQSLPEQPAYTFTTKVSPQGGGYIIRNPNKETYNANETVYVTAMSASGYTFTGYTGAVTSRANRVTVKMDSNKALTANFYRKSLQQTAHGEPAYKVFSGIGVPPPVVTDTVNVRYVDAIHSAKTPEPDFETEPKNTLLLDAVPLFIAISNGFDCWAFGFGVQYERRLFDKFSFIGRYDYFGVWDLGFDDGGYVSVKDWSSNLHTLETHARYYPTGKTFFLDGMLGYYVNTISGNYYHYNSGGNSSSGTYTYDHYSSGTYDYFKCGVSLGYRIRFGIVSRFTWELSFGWNFAFNADFGDGYSGDRYSLFLGGAGPRLVSAFGWRF